MTRLLPPMRPNSCHTLRQQPQPSSTGSSAGMAPGTDHSSSSRQRAAGPFGTMKMISSIRWSQSSGRTQTVQLQTRLKGRGSSSIRQLQMQRRARG